MYHKNIPEMIKKILNHFQTDNIVDAWKPIKILTSSTCLASDRMQSLPINHNEWFVLQPTALLFLITLWDDSIEVC